MTIGDKEVSTVLPQFLREPSTVQYILFEVTTCTTVHGLQIESILLRMRVNTTRGNV